MDILLTLLIIVASVLLVLVVFVQNPKGGGLSSDFGSAHQLGGVQKTNEFIDKATWGLAAVVAVLSIVMTIRMTPDLPTTATPEEAGTEQNDGQAPAGQTPVEPA